MVLGIQETIQPPVRTDGGTKVNGYTPSCVGVHTGLLRIDTIAFRACLSSQTSTW